MEVTEGLKQELEEVKIFALQEAKEKNLESKLEYNILVGRNQELFSFIDSTINGRVKQMVNEHILEQGTYDNIYVVNTKTGALIKYVKNNEIGASIMYVEKNEK